MFEHGQHHSVVELVAPKGHALRNVAAHKSGARWGRSRELVVDAYSEADPRTGRPQEARAQSAADVADERAGADVWEGRTETKPGYETIKNRIGHLFRLVISNVGSTADPQ